MASKSYLNRIKILNKKLSDNGGYPPVGFFDSWQIKEQEEFSKKYPKSIMFIGFNELED